MQVIGLKNELSETVVKSVLRKHMPSLPKESIDGLAKGICRGNVRLENDWALEQDLKDLGVRFA